MYKNIEDIKLKCSRCNNDFIFKGNITIEDIDSEYVDYYLNIFKKREELEKKLDYLYALNDRKKDKAVLSLLKKIRRCDSIIVNATDGNSVEAYNFFGLMYYPDECPECKEKRRIKKNKLKY